MVFCFVLSVLFRGSRRGGAAACCGILEGFVGQCGEIVVPEFLGSFAPTAINGNRALQFSDRQIGILLSFFLSVELREPAGEVEEGTAVLRFGCLEVFVRHADRIRQPVGKPEEEVSKHFLRRRGCVAGRDRLFEEPYRFRALTGLAQTDSVLYGKARVLGRRGVCARELRQRARVLMGEIECDSDPLRLRGGESLRSRGRVPCLTREPLHACPTLKTYGAVIVRSMRTAARPRMRR